MSTSSQRVVSEPSRTLIEQGIAYGRSEKWMRERRMAKKRAA